MLGIPRRHIEYPLPITIKSPEEQEKMRVAGRLAADVLDMIGEHVKPGVTTDELDRLCHDYIVQVQKAIPANVGYNGFPKTICTSVNHVVCHGIPNDRRLAAGDIINIGFDTSPQIVQGFKDGWVQLTSDQQPFLQGYMPVLSLCQQVVYGLGAINVDTGAGFVTPDNYEAVAALAIEGLR